MDFSTTSHSRSKGNLGKEISALVLINGLIALLLYGIGFAPNVGISLLYSQIIGASIYACVRGSYLLCRRASPAIQLLIIFAALVLGAVLGITISHIILYGEWFGIDGWQSRFKLKVMLLSLLFGTLISYLFISQKLLREIKAVAQEEKFNRLAREKEAMELELRLLQAQVEPHFLYNTLANIHSLLASDPRAAEKMLLDLSDFLRSSLELCRKKYITVNEEIRLLKSYLEIFKTRMGERLEYEFIVQEAAGERNIAPMLIQPLVENALQHGLEKNIDGGRITVRVLLEEDVLHVEVADTGSGFNAAQPAGIGTMSVHKRIRTLYGLDPRANIEFLENTPQGLIVRMTLPPLP